MLKGGELSTEKRGIIVAFLETGWTCREIAREGLASHTTASRIRKKFKEDGNLQCQQRPGRPKCTSYRLDRHLTRLSLQDRTASSFALRRNLLALPICVPPVIRGLGKAIVNLSASRSRLLLLFLDP